MDFGAGRGTGQFEMPSGVRTTAPAPQHDLVAGQPQVRGVEVDGDQVVGARPPTAAISPTPASDGTTKLWPTSYLSSISRTVSILRVFPLTPGGSTGPGIGTENAGTRSGGC